MNQPRTRVPFGTWPSPISPSMMAENLRLGDVQWDRSGRHLVWLEGRSDRGLLMVTQHNDPAAATELTTADHSVRAGVGYGGGDFTVADGVAFFVEQKSGRIFRQPLASGAARPITPGHGRCASPTVSPDGRYVLFVHSDGKDDCIAIVDADGKHWPQRLAWKADFFMQPCWSPDGKRIAFVSWKHPQMPWDGTVLMLADLSWSDAPLPWCSSIRELAGSDHVSIFQPQFTPDGKQLGFMSDETGFSNLYIQDLASGDRDAVTRHKAELARPAWAQGIRTWGFLPDGKRAVYAANERGLHRLFVVDLGTRESVRVDTAEQYTAIDQLAIHPTDDIVAALVGSVTIPLRVASFAIPSADDAKVEGSNDPASSSGTGKIPILVATTRGTVHARSSGERVAPDELSPVEVMEWKAPDGKPVYGLWHRPASARAESTGLPPCVVIIHGGPTSMRDARYDPGVQFLATRGYGVLQVNHRGSTGYGRSYTQALRGKWGILDVEDAVGGGQHLVDQHLVDSRRLVIMGGSAGGYTVLRALTTNPGFFRAGVCLFGVSDLFMLLADTHKFESRYTDSLVGVLPDATDVFRERSPIHSADRISDPIAIYQGSEDKVVPPNQSEVIVASLRARGVPHEYTLYEGEGHGWRKNETVKAFWASVEAFLLRHVIYS